MRLEVRFRVSARDFGYINVSRIRVHYFGTPSRFVYCISHYPESCDGQLNKELMITIIVKDKSFFKCNRCIVRYHKLLFFKPGGAHRV